MTGDSALRSLLSDSLAEDDPVRKLKRRFSKLNMARLCFGLGLLFLLDLHIDGFRFLPLCGFPALFAVGCWFLNGFAGEKRFTLCPDVRQIPSPLVKTIIRLRLRSI